MLTSLPLWAEISIVALASVGYLALGLAWWFLTFAFSYALNSGQLGRHWLLYPFQCFAEELPAYLPGGAAARREFIRSRVGEEGEGYMWSQKRTYSHEEIRKNDLYEEVFWAMMPGRASFWAGHLSALLFWPLGVGLLAAFYVFGLIAWPFRSLSQRVFQERPY